MPRDQLIQFRRGNASVWTSGNPVLAAGEVGYEADTRKVKIGDGASAWAALGYINVGNADTATTSVNITGGAAGSLPWQSAPGVTALLAIGAKGKVLQVDPTTGLPAWNLPKFTDFAASTSAALAALLSDETGTGAVVFNTSPSLITPLISAGGSVHTQASGTNTTTFVAAAGSASYTLTFPAISDTVVTSSVLTPYFKQDASGNYLDLGNRGILFNGNVNLAMPSASGTLALTTVVNGYVKADGSTPYTGPVNFGGNALSGITNLTMSGTFTDTSLVAGLLKAGAGGTVTGGNKAVLTTDVTGSLPVANGGTGGVDVKTARQGLRIFVQSAQPSSSNITGYTPQADDIWFW